MTQATAAERPGASNLGEVVTHRRWLAPGGVFLILVALCTLAGYWLMFSQFAVYDDEGFFDYSVQLFASGHPMYNSVFSDYGPFYYLVFGGFFALIDHAVTTDAGRLIQLTLWILTTLGIGLIAHRLTGRLTVAVAALATTFALLNGATSEPMHASMLNDFMLMLMAATAVFGIPRRPDIALSVIGAIAAALLLIKINVGGYAIVGIAFAVVMAGGRLARFAPLRLSGIAAFTLVGPAVMAGKLNTEWARSYALLAVLSTLAITFVAGPTRVGWTGRDGSERWPVLLIGGFVSALVVILAIVFALGTSPGELIDQILIVPSHQGSILVIPIVLGGQVIWWSLALAGLAWSWARLAGIGTAKGDQARLSDGLLRTVAGVAILLSLGDQSLFAVSPNAVFSLAMPLAWVAALPSRRDPPGAAWRLTRLLIPSLAVTQALLAFPVAGTQLGYGSILLVLCGAMCLAEGWSELTAWNARVRAGAALAGPLLGTLFAVLAAGATWQYIIQPVWANRDQYSANTALKVKGATALRLSATQGGAIDRAVAQIRSHGCRTLISYPGMYSFDIWTGLPYVTALTGEQPYWRLLSYEQQFKVLQAAERSPGLCAIRNDALAATYGGHPERSPVVKFIDKDFTPLAAANPYLVEVRRRPAAQPVRAVSRRRGAHPRR